MFDLRDAYQNVDINFILNTVSEYDIWKKYCNNFEELDKPFLSELYNDRNPACRIKHNKFNKLIYKDFGTGDTYSCFDYIQIKYSCNFKESLKIVYNDFKLGSIKYDILPQLVLNNQPEVVKMSSKPIIIEIIPKSYNYTDYKLWGDYNIPLELLEKEEIISCKTIYLHKNDKTITYNSSLNNPIYAWKEYDIDLNFLGYKVYSPLASSKYKWLNNASSEAIQGIKTLEYNSNILILTKSRKDILVLKILGYNAISLSSENTLLKKNVFNYFNTKYDKIFCLYDNDETGIKYSKYLLDMYNISPIFVCENCKDISDYIKQFGIEKTKILMDKLLYDS